jgi:hypothetical protein
MKIGARVSYTAALLLKVSLQVSGLVHQTEQNLQ